MKWDGEPGVIVCPGCGNQRWAGIGPCDCGEPSPMTLDDE